jgi:hypothetical protein
MELLSNFSIDSDVTGEPNLRPYLLQNYICCAGTFRIVDSFSEYKVSIVTKSILLAVPLGRSAESQNIDRVSRLVVSNISHEINISALPMAPKSLEKPC